MGTLTDEAALDLDDFYEWWDAESALLEREQERADNEVEQWAASQ